MLSKDTFHLSLSFLPFKETFNVSLVCKLFNKWWVNWQCQDILRIKDINIVDRYKFFKFSLNLSGTNITDISKFDVKNLHTLYLYGTNIADISKFDVKNLHSLNLSRTNITDISKFDVKNLHILYLWETKITDISNFDVKNLHSLYLWGTNITNEEKNKLSKKVKNVY